MTSIDRTAYPRFTNHLNQRELKERYSVTIEERLFISQAAKGSSGRLTLAILLKVRQQLGYFPFLNDVPLAIRRYLATVLDEPEKTQLADTVNLKKTRSRYRNRISIRAFLHCRPYIDDGPEFIKPIIATAAPALYSCP